MPRTRQRASSPEQVEESLEEPIAEATQPLQFDQPLTWRAGRPIAVGELLRRLKTLAEELQSMEQDDVDRDSMVPKAQELASQQLLGHKDKGVRAWTMLCIVKMFQLLAPDAPYKAGQLKQIFDIFASHTVPALATLSDPYYEQHFTTLYSLAESNGIILLTDIPASGTLILTLFSSCFDVVSGNVKGGDGEQLPNNVQFFMTKMLVALVEECTPLPDGVVEKILAQFLRVDPAAIAHGGKHNEQAVLREVPPAYDMARSICITCTDKISRAVGQYFSSVLIDASEALESGRVGKSRGKKRTHDESESESDDDLLAPSAEHDLQDVEQMHRLLRELWRSSPDIIQSVIPQMEAEVAAENVQLRTMAVQTVGDMIAGIGAAGPPPPPTLDPAAYPSQSLETSTTAVPYWNVLLAPAAPRAFSSVHPAVYQGFVDRHRDKAAAVRGAWATAVGRIISTSGGGKGLVADEEQQLTRHLSDMLVDQDERVRLAAVQAVVTFDFNTIVQKLGDNGGFGISGSALSNLADRIKDRKHHVRAAAIELLGRIWGVAAGAIAEGSERVRDILGPIPSKIFMAVYINDREINALVQKVLYDSLLPLNFPPIKSKLATNGDSQRVKDSQTASRDDAADPDAIRAERILVLVRDLERKAKEVFFMLQQQQNARAKYLEAYIQACNKINGVATEGEQIDETTAKRQLDRLIEALASFTPDHTTSTEHLQKFAKHHDRRSYQLIRFCYNAESDYRRIAKAMRELAKRMEEASGGMAAVLDTLLPLVRSASILVYSRSHVPAIMKIARTDEKELGTTAHEVLTEISAKAPDVFKVHVQELCEGLKKQAPSASSPNNPTAVEELKACAGFARRFPEEMPKSRDFYRAMAAFAKHGTPPKAAKHAVTIIVASADKREMYIKDILKYCLTNFEYGEESFLSRLAALSQIRLVAEKDAEEYNEAIMDVAVTKILKGVSTMADGTEPAWTDEMDDDLSSKLWALKILVNGLRGINTSSDLLEAKEQISVVADPVYKLLNTLIHRDGELSKDGSTPKNHKAHLRLAAANHLLKLSCRRVTDQFLAPADFNNLAKVSQDPLSEVRANFVKSLKKYLGQGKLPNRFYGLVFMYAFEPSKPTKESVTTWLKSRAALSAKQRDTVLESVFARFLSLLAHHQDFSPETEDLEDFVEYIMFYLKTVATETNVPLIYHIAQRLKSVQDGIDPEKSDHLYILSDLAEAVIRCFQDIHGWSLQLYSGKVRLPTSIFAPLPSHTKAQEIAEKQYIPEEFAERLEDLVKASMKPKKRKSEGVPKQTAKKVKPTTDGEKKLPVRKAAKKAKPPRTPKKAADTTPSSERRKSTRASNVTNYAENEESDDDEELEHWQADENEANKENITSSSSSPPPPPPNDPAPPTLPTRKEKPAQKPVAKKPSGKQTPRRSTRATRATKNTNEKATGDDEPAEPSSGTEA